MSRRHSAGLSRRWMAAILIAAALSFVGKVVIASRTFGSTDALLWEANLRQLREAGPVELYEKGTDLHDNGVSWHHEVFNHPPFMVHVLSAGGWVSERSRMPFRFWLRLACAAADLLSILLLLRMRTSQTMPSPAALFLVAASPISLLISGFHGNTDPIMMALLVLALYLAHRNAAGLSGGVLALAAGIKIVPLLFVPALVFALPGRKRAVFLTAAAGIYLLGSFPLAFSHPALICSRVFGYNPQAAVWGMSRLVAAFGREAVTSSYLHMAKGTLLLILAAVSVWLNVHKPRPPLFLRCGPLPFVLLSITPGFGVQYLTWLVPFACLLSAKQALAFHGAGGLLLTLYYTRAAHGFPWYLANSAATQVWYGSVIYAALLCWAVIVWLMFCLMRRVLELRKPL